MIQRTAREEELQIEVERLKQWLGWIASRAHFEEPHGTLESMAEKAIAYSSCAAHTDWDSYENYASLGLWPKHCTVEQFASD